MRHPRSNLVSANTTRWQAVVVTAVAVLALLGVMAAVGPAAAQTERPTVVVTNGTAAAEDTTTVDIVLTNAPDGLSGYYLDVTVENPEVARIESASYPDRFGLTSEPEIGADGASATLEAADIDDTIQPGSTDVTLVTLTVSFVDPGEAELAVEPRQFDADGGNVFNPSTQPGVVIGSTADASDAEATNDEADADENAARTPSAGDARMTPDLGRFAVTPAVLSIAALAILAIGLAALVVRRH